MQENVYDNPSFFEKYGEMLRSKEGLKGAGEWPTLAKLLPAFEGKRVLDLGCGYGWHCLYAASGGATKVLGIDLSAKMLEEAVRRNTFPAVEYRRMGIEDFDYPAESYEVVISSLAFHYIEDLHDVFRRVYRTLTAGGTFVFTIEHPVFTAYGTQDWIYATDGEPLHWPVDRYFCEGSRETRFLGEKVMKYHHTLTSLIQGLLQAGFTLRDVVEPQPTSGMLRDMPAMKDELRRPMMIAFAADKKG